jgi:predicted signal transduction protein with EAL and GGDEF domain
MPGQTMKDVIERADAAMYKDKEARRSSAAAGGQQ